MNPIDILNDQLKKIEEFESKLTDKIVEGEKLIEKVLNIIGEIDLSWSGSWIGYYAQLYYKNFEKPPPGDEFDSEWGGLHGISDNWLTLEIKDIYEYIEEKLQIFEIDKKIKMIIEECIDYQEIYDNFVVALQFIKDMDNFSSETEELNKLENITWFVDRKKFVLAKRPRQMITRDSQAAKQRPVEPPHISVESFFRVFQTFFSALKKFFYESKQLIRKIQNRLEFKSRPENLFSEKVKAVELICKRFHFIARQLRDRYNDRPTLDISDEYDVQDLLHSLLKLFFDDIRKEEYTPSYAASTTRMDFLLKNEQIVIEVKKTRKGLNAKKVGEELILDIAHYQEHPDCKLLICFVYDPEGIISNPTGLVKDLEQRTTDEFTIKVYIEP
ncbi:MAG: hypothetical protein ACTSUK_02590 [Promethearchaeota archaeon]